MEPQADKGMDWLRRLERGSGGGFTLLALLRRETSVPIRKLLFMAGLAGLSNALVLAIINSAAQSVSADPDLRDMLMFLAVIGIYMISQRFMMRVSAEEVERVIHRLRQRIVEKVSRTDLEPLERIGRSDIHSSIVRDTQTISQAANIIVMGCQSAILVLFAMAYIALMSMTAFVLSISFTAAAALFHMRRMGELQGELRLAMERENRLFDGLGGLLDGFKEVKLSSDRRDALLGHLRRLSQEAADLKVQAQTQSGEQFVLAQTIFFLLLGVMVFVVPMFSASSAAVVVKTTTAILFIIGPLGLLIQSIPVFANANAAAENIVQLDARLSELAARQGDCTPQALPRPFASISFDGVSFTYHDDKAAAAFAVGPIDLTIREGEIVFVTGGNGSGKSTFIKLLLGLYYPDRGVIRYGGIPLTAETYESYRNSFAAVFADYHLFRQLFGIEAPDPQRADDLIRWLELTGKTRLTADAFDTVDLSSGQRKRLALMSALLEERPILVLDEWAADQDPAFRRKFYREILPALKAQGKTIIAVTHDDRYFDVADRRIGMEEGRLVVHATSGEPPRGEE